MKINPLLFVAFLCLSFICQIEAAAQSVEKADIFRFYNSVTGFHLFTSSSTIGEDAIKRGYKSEGIGFSVSSKQTDQTFPLYRYYNERGAANGIAVIENRIIQFAAADYRRIELLGYAYRKPHEGALPLYEFANGTDMFYTISSDEARSVIEHNPDSYVGIAGYVYGNDNHVIPFAPPSKTVVGPRQQWFSQVFYNGSARKKINIPDILGYQTIKCDFHMHTVFSDGEVWPDYRANEIWAEGLDAFSITDHIEYVPHSKDLPKNLNRPFQIAIERANPAGLICVKGAEITRDFPSSGWLSAHFNALFLNDVEKLDVMETEEAIKAAYDQNAFIFWNHPPEKWGPEIEAIFANGWLSGIEIVNGDAYYPKAFAWALEKKLTIVGNTDVHDPMILGNGQHRTMTLVFAKERTERAIKEALIDHRTAVYSGNDLYGDPMYLKALFDASVNLANSNVSIKQGSAGKVTFTNTSDVPFRLVFDTEISGFMLPKELILKANGNTILSIDKNKSNTFIGKKDVTLQFHVKNLITAPDSCLANEKALHVTLE